VDEKLVILLAGTLFLSLTTFQEVAPRMTHSVSIFTLMHTLQWGILYEPEWKHSVIAHTYFVVLTNCIWGIRNLACRLQFTPAECKKLIHLLVQTAVRVFTCPAFRQNILEAGQVIEHVTAAVKNVIHNADKLDSGELVKLPWITLAMKMVLHFSATDRIVGEWYSALVLLTDDQRFGSVKMIDSLIGGEEASKFQQDFIIMLIDGELGKGSFHD
jgi:hypothetical protein